jgi:mono/diheme cytochrome c family protein
MPKNFLFVSLIMGFMGVTIFSSFKMQLPKVIQDVWKAPSWADTITNPFPDEPLVLMQGEELYQMYCEACHGRQGYGDGAAGGAFGPNPANFHAEEVKNQSDGVLYWKLSTGRGIMPPFKDVFSEEQRWQLVAYIRKLSTIE